MNCDYQKYTTTVTYVLIINTLPNRQGHQHIAAQRRREHIQPVANEGILHSGIIYGVYEGLDGLQIVEEGLAQHN